MPTKKCKESKRSKKQGREYKYECKSCGLEAAREKQLCKPRKI